MVCQQKRLDQKYDDTSGEKLGVTDHKVIVFCISVLDPDRHLRQSVFVSG